MSACSLPPAMPAGDPSDQGGPGTGPARAPGRPLRIGIEAHVVNSRPSGNGRVVANLVDAMAGVSPHRFFVYVTDPDVASAWGRRAGSNVTVRRVPGGASPFLRIPAVLPFMAARDRVDVFLAHDVRPPVAPFPVVTLVHDLAFERYPEFFSRYERAWMTRGFRYSCRHSAGVITVSNFTRDEIVGLYGVPAARISVAWNGVDPSFLSGKARTAPVEPPYFLAVGTLQPRKNLATLIRAFRSLRARSPQIRERLVIVGAPGFRSDAIVGEARDLQAAGLLEFTGYLGGDALIALMQHATAFAYPSVYEGFGLPPLEAMAAGAPVAVSDIPVTREVLGDAALFVPAMDAEAWSKALESVATDATLRERLVGSGRAHAAEFTWARSAQVALDALEGAAGTRNRRSRPRPNG
jgi:glycosyltransferase involved in cell wall biosynthesis